MSYSNSNIHASQQPQRKGIIEWNDQMELAWIRTPENYAIYLNRNTPVVNNYYTYVTNNYYNYPVYERPTRPTTFYNVPWYNIDYPTRGYSSSFSRVQPIDDRRFIKPTPLIHEYTVAGIYKKEIISVQPSQIEIYEEMSGKKYDTTPTPPKPIPTPVEIDSVIKMYNISTTPPQTIEQFAQNKRDRMLVIK